MGFLSRTFTPKPLKQAKRIAHPVSLVTPRPVRNIQRAAARAVDPVGAIGDMLETEAVRAARGSGRKHRARASGPGDSPQWQGDVIADFGPGDVISEWTPSGHTASQVPILHSIKAFLVLENDRLTASRELADATTQEDRLEALAIVTKMYALEVPMIADLAGSGRLDQTTDPDVARCWSWTKAWMDASEQDWQHRSDELTTLVDSMDEAALESVTSRVEARTQEIAERADKAAGSD